MSYFCHETYKALLQKVRAANPEDLETIREAAEYCLQYVYTVCRGENRLNTLAENDREIINDYDQTRHHAHENAILYTNILNRLAAQHGIAPVYTGDTANRHQVADFCLELADWLFRERRRIL